MSLKRCPSCNEEKPINDFAIRKSGRPGHPVAHCKKCCVEKNKQRARRNPISAERTNRRSKYKRQYQITLEQYDEMFEQQGGCCAICGTDKPDDWHKHFSVDHCHATGRVRGLLCGNCNNGLGRFRDNPSLLLRAVQYLKDN